MKAEDFKKITEEMTEKIGKEKASVVADNFATIISDNMQMNEELTCSADKALVLLYWSACIDYPHEVDEEIFEILYKSHKH